MRLTKPTHLSNDTAITDSDKPSLLSWGLLILLSLTWGSSYILIKKGLIAYEPTQMASLRISITAMALVPFMLMYWRRINWNQWKSILIVAMAGSGFPSFLFAVAQTHLDSSTTGVLSSLSPLFTLFLGVLFFKVPFIWSKVIGVLIGLVGALSLILFGESTSSSGGLFYGGLVMAATLLYALSANTVKAEFQTMHPLELSAATFLMIGPPAVIYLFTTDFMSTLQNHPQGWTSLGYISILALVGTFAASVLFFKLVQLTNAVFASMVSYFIPMIALGWGVLDGEAITVMHLLGMVLILAGVYVAQRPR